MALVGLAATVLFLLPATSLAIGFVLLWAVSHLLLPPATRRFLRRFAATTLLLSGFFYAGLGPHSGTVALGPWRFNGADFELGLVSGARLAALVVLFAVTSRYLPARELLPYVTRGGLPAYIAGSLVRLVPTLRADAERLRDAQRVRGHAFRPGLRGARSWIPFLVPLFVSTLRRAREQALALHLAGASRLPGAEFGNAQGAQRWARIVALAALAIVGRLSLVAVPGVSFSYFVLFVAGVAYGPRVGFWVGLLERLATDLMLSGLNPIFLPMAPVEALLGLAAGGAGMFFNFGQRDREPYPYAFFLAGTAGALLVLLFSVAADTSTWLFFRGVLPQMDTAMQGTLWTALVLRGLAFNVPAAVFNAFLFGAATYPVLRALRTSGALPSRAAPATAATRTAV